MVIKLIVIDWPRRVLGKIPNISAIDSIGRTLFIYRIYRHLTNSREFLLANTGGQEQRLRRALPQHEVWPGRQQRAVGILSREVQHRGEQLEADGQVGQSGRLGLRARHIRARLGGAQIVGGEIIVAALANGATNLRIG